MIDNNVKRTSIALTCLFFTTTKHLVTTSYKLIIRSTGSRRCVLWRDKAHISAVHSIAVIFARMIYYHGFDQNNVLVSHAGVAGSLITPIKKGCLLIATWYVWFNDTFLVWNLNNWLMVRSSVLVLTSCLTSWTRTYEFQLGLLFSFWVHDSWIRVVRARERYFRVGNS